MVLDSFLLLPSEFGAGQSSRSWLPSPGSATVDWRHHPAKLYCRRGLSLKLRGRY